MKADIRICILQRGWVVVGRWSKDGQECRIESAYVIRRWGTSKGLGQIAIEGPTTNTVLEPVTTVRYHEMNEVANMTATHKRWQEICK